MNNIEYTIGLKVIYKGKFGYDSQNKGTIIDFKDSNIIIEWVHFNQFSKSMFTKPMLDSCFSENLISIDKEYYREEKLKEIGL